MFLRKQKAAHLINTGSIQPFGTDKAVPFATKYQKPWDFGFHGFFLSVDTFLFEFLADLFGHFC